MIQAENGKAARTLNNYDILEKQHGRIVGLIHRVFPDNTQAPFLFFRDGFVHEATGISTGIGEKGEAFTEILSNVCGGWNYVHAVPMMGGPADKVFEKAKIESRSVYYCFPPIGMFSFSVENSDGMNAFDEYKARVYSEDLGEILDMDEAI